MRTNLTGFALTVGMGLIVVLLGFLGLSATGLVGFSADEAQAQPLVCGNVAEPIDSTSNSQVDVFLSPEAKAGDALFKANCAQCHAVNEKVVGPALADIDKRRPLSWIVPWVQNSAKVVASGDEYGVKLYNDNGKQQMPSFALSKKEIEDIVAWVTAQQGSSVTATQVVYCEGVDAQ